jgi:CTP:molybdopterin cytidylyltransferase MocA
MPADMANLESRDLQRLARRWQAAPRRVVARRVDRSGAAPLILPRRLFRSARNIGGDLGLRDFIAQLPADLRVLVELPSAAADVDTPHDLRIVRRRYRALR